MTNQNRIILYYVGGEINKRVQVEIQEGVHGEIKEGGTGRDTGRGCRVR